MQLVNDNPKAAIKQNLSFNELSAITSVPKPKLHFGLRTCDPQTVIFQLSRASVKSYLIIFRHIG